MGLFIRELGDQFALTLLTTFAVMYQKGVFRQKGEFLIDQAILVECEDSFKAYCAKMHELKFD